MHDARRHHDAGRRCRTLRHRRRHHRRRRHSDGDEHHRRRLPDRVPRRSSGPEHVDRQPAAQPRRRQHGDRPGRRRRFDRHSEHDRDRRRRSTSSSTSPGSSYAADSATQGRFVPATPERIVDTRQPGSSTGRLAPGGSALVPRPAGVAADAIGLVLNVTSVEATEDGFLSISPTNGPVTTTSFMNPDGSGDPLAAFVIAPLIGRRLDHPRNHGRPRHRRPDRLVHGSVSTVEHRRPVRTDHTSPPPRHP